jgi:KRAB domain-containing zinc finger protein
VHETGVKKLRCQTCGKAFKDRQTLRGHERTHDATRQGSSDPCPECGKRFSSRGALREHVKTVHRKASFRHTCEDCGQTFPYLHMLQIHAEMAHLKGTLLVCQVEQNSLA